MPIVFGSEEHKEGDGWGGSRGWETNKSSQRALCPELCPGKMVGWEKAGLAGQKQCSLGAFGCLPPSTTLLPSSKQVDQCWSDFDLIVESLKDIPRTTTVTPSDNLTNHPTEEKTNLKKEHIGRSWLVKRKRLRYEERRENLACTISRYNGEDAPKTKSK